MLRNGENPMLDFYKNVKFLFWSQLLWEVNQPFCTGCIGINEMFFLPLWSLSSILLSTLMDKNVADESTFWPICFHDKSNQLWP
jgi:hypothetical protein